MRFDERLVIRGVHFVVIEKFDQAFGSIVPRYHFQRSDSLEWLPRLVVVDAMGGCGLARRVLIEPRFGRIRLLKLDEPVQRCVRVEEVNHVGSARDGSANSSASMAACIRLVEVRLDGISLIGTG